MADKLCWLMPKGPSPKAWALLLAAGGATATIGAVQGFRLAMVPLLATAFMGVLMYGLAVFYSTRRPQDVLAFGTSGAAYFVAFSIVMGPMCYVAASLGMPLQDELFSRFDRAIGFDWLRTFKVTMSTPGLAEAASLVYGNSAYQMLLAWIALVATRQFDRLAGLLGALALATVITLAVSAFLPAVGAYSFHGVTDALLPNMRGTGAGAWHVKDLLAVRDGSLRFLDPKTMEGIVQFPSFHSVVAAMAGWATFRIRLLRWPMALFSAAVIATTLPIGGHYVIDILAAMAVTACALRIMGPMPAATPAFPSLAQQEEAAAT